MKFREWLSESSVNRTGGELGGLGVVRGPHAFNQSERNCYRIAAEVARRHGFGVPSLQTVGELVSGHLVNRLFGGQPIDPRSPGVLVIRRDATDGVTDLTHVTFEFRGKEFNYGPSGDHFPILMRIPLRPLTPAGTAAAPSP